MTTTGDRLVGPQVPESARTRLAEIGEVIDAELSPELTMQLISHNSHGIEWNITLDGKVYPLLLLPPKRKG